MLLKFWQEDSVEVKGNYYEIPYPYEDGIDYPAWKSARDAGGIGEIGDDNRVRRVSVVPKPYQEPYPPVFQAVSASPDSIKFAARHGSGPCISQNWKRWRNSPISTWKRRQGGP